MGVCDLDFVQRLKEDGRLLISEQSHTATAAAARAKAPSKIQEVKQQLRTLQSTFAAEAQSMPLYRTGDAVNARHYECFALSGEGVEKGAGDMPDWGSVLGPIEKSEDGRILVQPTPAEPTAPSQRRSHGHSHNEATLAPSVSPSVILYPCMPHTPPHV